MQNTVHSMSLDIIDVQYMDMSTTYFNKIPLIFYLYVMFAQDEGPFA